MYLEIFLADFEGPRPREISEALTKRSLERQEPTLVAHYKGQWKLGFSLNLSYSSWKKIL